MFISIKCNIITSKGELIPVALSEMNIDVIMRVNI